MKAKAQFSIEPVPVSTEGPRTWLLVDLGEFSLPRHFQAATQLDGLNVRLEIEVDDDGKPCCREIAIRPAQGDALRLSGETLRKVSDPRLLADAMADAAQKWVLPKKAGTPSFHSGGKGDSADYHYTLRPPTGAERASFYEQHAAGARRPRRGSPITDDNLKQVSSLYREAIKGGDPPTQTVADAMHVARSTAARWVMAARKRGFLGPAMPGRAGEREEQK